MRVLGPDEHIRSDDLTGCYPYWWLDDGVNVARFAGEAMKSYPAARRRLDPVSVLGLLSFEHLTLDRTMLRGLRRLPWMSELDAHGSIRFQKAPPHKHRLATPAQIAKGLVERALDEVRSWVKGDEDIYVLLSGGMDSRVLVAMLKHLERNGELTNSISAVTWGIEGSRDVLYARRLAESLGWDWTHAPLNAETYWENFELTATRLGAEIDPKHLHRMAWFRNVTKPSLVLAASYGDMIGRAEFGGVHLTNLTQFAPRDRNRLLTPTARDYAAPRLLLDVEAPRHRHGKRSDTGHLEIGRALHYMRRELQHPMCIIEQYGHRLHQMFTSRRVFEFMWAHEPSLRTDEVYTHVLRSLDPAMLDLAWARTGSRYDEQAEAQDDASKQHHRYGYWLRTAHADKIGELLFSPTLGELTVFDTDQVRWMYDAWLKEVPEHETELCTQLSMLATISMFAERYHVLPPRFDKPSEDSGKLDRTLARLSVTARRLTRPLRLRLSQR